ncbi:two-component system response regulator [Christiangramia fulva]|uniref:Two-component system response regulator n=1 Tax=Christiangramia fulva TaxID=2126553 RepID=A0A2R3Z9A4_9FLAO|nr:response regulator transcription factor [Christiangramia fulva]AVR46858.1 two-component system response regulator [Christiangramia fulva]
MNSRLLIFEDNDSLRASMVSLLQNEEGYFLVGDFSNVLDVKNILEKLNPDIVILDIDMPGKDGIWAIPIIKEFNPLIHIVMYTQFEDDEKLFKSLCAGADGYVLKKTSPFKLVKAIKEVEKGGAPMSPSIAKKVLSSFKQIERKSTFSYDLTEREIQVLNLLVKGYSIKYMASELGIAYETCRSHLKNIYTKLHVNCGKEAIAKVLSEKIELE